MEIVKAQERYNQSVKEVNIIQYHLTKDLLLFHSNNNLDKTILLNSIQRNTNSIKEKIRNMEISQIQLEKIYKILPNYTSKL
jgi:hypothetical protein